MEIGLLEIERDRQVEVSPLKYRLSKKFDTKKSEDYLRMIRPC